MANTYTFLSSTTVGSGGTSTISFTSIPQTYGDLVLVCSLRSNYAGVPEVTKLNFNNNSSSVYSYETMRTDGGASATTAKTSNTSRILLYSQNGDTATSNAFGLITVYIPSYTNSQNKSIIASGAAETDATYTYLGFQSGVWANTAAITQIDLAPTLGTSFKQYSTAYLYGIKNS